LIFVSHENPPHVKTFGIRSAELYEGPGSPIETILAQDASRQQINGVSPAASSSEGETKGSLADRIRALQNRASRLSSA
jgi:hypothetical protein